MQMRKIFFFLVLLFPGVLGAMEPPVKASLVSELASFVPGHAFRLGLRLQHQPGWHTYWKDPGDAGQATSLQWTLPQGFKAGPIQWPQPRHVKDAGGLNSNIYTGETLLVVEIVPPAHTTQPALLKARADWIVCKEVCIPGGADLQLTLNPSAQESPSADASLFAAVTPKLGLPPTSESHPLTPAQGEEENAGSFWSLLFYAFVGGLILNVMPCVLPVLSLKVISFVKQAHESHTRSAALGGAFSAGILVSFWALAGAVVTLKAAGMAAGWGFQFQNPGFVAAMAVLVTVFSLNLLGVFEINAPASGVQELAEISGRSGLGGAFANGVLMTLLATPCTAPFLGSAMGFAFSQSGGVLFLFFTAAAVGLALPYQLLSLFPRALGWLPRPGTWMIYFKQLMGFLLLAAVIWLLSVLGSEAGQDAVLATAFFLLAIGLACWLWGTFVAYGSSFGRRAGIGALIVVILFPLYHLVLRPALAARPESKAGAREGWEPYSAARLSALLSERKTVFLDFTAEWCWTCKVNERAVLAKTAVQSRMAQLGVVKMKADYTRMDPEVGKLLHSFGRPGVPLYVIYPGSAPDKPIVLPELVTSAIVLEGLEKAGASLPMMSGK
jgi:thiol:disulfide interchange protein DsbD